MEYWKVSFFYAVCWGSWGLNKLIRKAGSISGSCQSSVEDILESDGWWGRWGECCQGMTTLCTTSSLWVVGAKGSFYTDAPLRDLGGPLIPQRSDSNKSWQYMVVIFILLVLLWLLCPFSVYVVHIYLLVAVVYVVLSPVLMYLLSCVDGGKII